MLILYLACPYCTGGLAQSSFAARSKLNQAHPWCWTQIRYQKDASGHRPLGIHETISNSSRVRMHSDPMCALANDSTWPRLLLMGRPSTKRPMSHNESHVLLLELMLVQLRYGPTDNWLLSHIILSNIGGRASEHLAQKLSAMLYV